MKLFLAGADGTYFQGIISTGGHKHFLTSYYNALKDTKDLKAWLNVYKHEIANGADWIVDSGLFTMMFGAGKNKSYSYSEIETYTKNYVNFMHNINYQNTIVEMDVHKILGLKPLYILRELIKDKWDIKDIIFVWHIEEGIKGFKDLVNAYPYIGISVPELRILNSKKTFLMIQNLAYIARKIKPAIKIHLLGCSTLAFLVKGIHIYSCDSISWKEGTIYDSIAFFNHNKLRNYSKKSNVYKLHFQKFFTDFQNKYIQHCQTLQIAPYQNWEYAFKDYLSVRAYHNLENYINNRFFSNNK